MLPDDPFVKDMEGASRFCRELLKRLFVWHDVDWSPATYWSARCAAHWAMRSNHWLRTDR